MNKYIVGIKIDVVLNVEVKAESLTGAIEIGKTLVFSDIAKQKRNVELVDSDNQGCHSVLEI